MHEGPTDGGVESIDPNQTRGKTDVRYRLVSKLATRWLRLGRVREGARHIPLPCVSRSDPIPSDGGLCQPDNAVYYYYYLALTFYELHGEDAGMDVPQQAVQLERREPIANWGKRMERVQG